MEITKEIVLQNLKDTNWDSESKSRLQPLVDLCGQRSLEWLYGIVSSSQYDLVCKYIVDAVQVGVSASQSLLHGDGSGFRNLITTAPDDKNYDYGTYAVPFIVDAISNSPALVSNYLQELRVFEQKTFKKLPSFELLRIVGHDIVHFIGAFDLMSEFKLVLYYQNVEDLQAWGKMFSYALENSEELLGKQQLIIDGKIYKPEIRNWIKDFIVSQPMSVTQRSTFEEIQYIKKSANVAKLTPNEQQQLATIIKLYKWFLEPSYTVEEVEEYEQSLYPPEEGEQDSLPSVEVATSKPEVVQQKTTEPVTWENVEKKPVISDVAKPQPAPSSFGFKKPAVAPPSTGLNIEEIMKRQVKKPEPPVVAPKPIVPKDEKKQPISAMADILRQKEELEHKIDERIEDLKKRVPKKQ